MKAHSRVAAVTVMEDRARVVRSAALDVEPGPQRIELSGVAPVLADATLTAAADGHEVVGVRVVRRPVLRDADRDDQLRTLLGRVREAEEDVQRASADQQRAERLLQDLQRALRLLLTEAGDDVARGAGDPTTWDAALRDLGDWADATSAWHAGVVADLQDAHRVLEERRERLLQASRPTGRVSATIEVDLLVTADHPLELTVSYVVPGALWRPWHRARLTGGDGAAVIVWETAAAVWQRTGEDWADVELTFSTARPSLGVEPPRLRDDRLEAVHAGRRVEVEQRDEAIATTGLGADVARLHEVPGIADGGETRVLTAGRRATVPSDGRPQRVPIGGFEAPADVGLVTRPELVESVLLRSVQVNSAPWPLLAGPVELLRDAGPAGRTTIGFVAPAERFELGWGPEPTLRVARRVDRAEVRTGLLSSWTAERRTVTVRLSNLAAAPATVEVTERIPVSEVEKVRVDDIATGPSADPDANGIVHQHLEVPGYGYASASVAHTLSRHPDVAGTL